MLAHCTNKSCNTTTEIKLDPDTKEPVCTTCGGKVDLNSFMIKTMMANGDYLVKAKKGFQFHCPKCNKQQSCIIDAGICKCTVCGGEVPITPQMKEVMKNLDQTDSVAK
jgi:hypothetical protein